MSDKLIIVILVVLKLLEAVATTIFDPFLPSEGRRKHLTLTHVGVIIGTIMGTSAIAALLVGKGIPIFGSKFTLILGSSLKGLFLIMFGTLIDLPDGLIFFTMCVVEAAFMGLASSMTLNACNTNVALFFPKRISAIQGLTETAYFIGLSAGPPIGGALFSLGGYKTPFYVTGGVIIASVTFAFIYLPSHEYENTYVSDKPLIELAKSLKIWLMSLTIFLPPMVLVSLNVLLPVYFQETLKLSVLHTGLIFMVRSVVGCVGSLFVGYYYNIRWMKILCILGLVFLCVSCLFLGPSPLLPWLPESSLWLIIVCHVGMGIGNSFITTTMYENMLHEAFECGFTDNLDTYSKISTIFESVQCSGAFVGPVLGGFLFDTVGYKWTVTVLAFMLAAMIPAWFCVNRDNNTAK